MVGLLSGVRRLNGLGNRAVAEPFAGGAGAALSLLYLEETHRIHINDADPAIYDFWWALLRRSAKFLELLSKTRVNIVEWRMQRDTYRSKQCSRLKRGFATFYLNRCNRSGIIVNGGPIGGISQTGKWKLDARYTRTSSDDDASEPQSIVNESVYLAKMDSSSSSELSLVQPSSLLIHHTSRRGQCSTLTPSLANTTKRLRHDSRPCQMLLGS